MRGIVPLIQRKLKTSLRIYFSQFHLAKSAEIQTLVWLERERREDLHSLPTFIFPFGTRQLPQLSGSGPHDLLFRSLTPYIFIQF